MTISVIIPTLNEQRRIGSCLDHVLDQGGFDEVIVVDGGSSDRTRQIAASRPVQIVDAPRGRGQQLNAGAELARADVLLFLHVDVELPSSSAAIISQILRAPSVVGGAFRTWTVPDPGTKSRLGPLLHVADLRSRYSRLPYGDQAMFVRAECFRTVGGFANEPLMEDLGLSRRLRRLGRIKIARESVRVSGRRFESAPLRQTLCVNIFPMLYAIGVSPTVLARLYGNPR